MTSHVLQIDISINILMAFQLKNSFSFQYTIFLHIFKRNTKNKKKKKILSINGIHRSMFYTSSLVKKDGILTFLLGIAQHQHSFEWKHTKVADLS